jgi:hypothetical protein
MCIAEARKRGRLLRLALQADGAMSRGSLQWIEGPEPTPLIGAIAGRC